MKTKKNAAKAVTTPNIKSNADISAPAPTSIATAKTALAAPASSPSSNDVTIIDVKMDVGFGNAVFLRGEGGGLNWDRGVQLSCVDGKTWRWSAKVKAPITFKALINDQVWSAGNDLTVKPGQKLEVQPTFS